MTPPKRIGKETTQTSVRVDPDELARMDALTAPPSRLRADVFRDVIKYGLAEVEAYTQSLRQKPDPGEFGRVMAFEDAARYVHDQCGRFETPDGLGDADVFRTAEMTYDWSDVARALATAVGRVEKDAQAIVWSAEENGVGGLAPNFLQTLHDVQEKLAQPTKAAVFGALSDAVHALKALTLKATGDTSRRYQGDPTSPWRPAGAPKTKKK